MVDLKEVRRKQIKRWKQKKRGISRSESAKFLLELYSSVPEIVSDEMLDEEFIQKHKKALLARRTRQALLHKKTLDSLKEKAQKDMKDIRKKLMDYKMLVGDYEKVANPNWLLKMVDPGEALKRKIELDAQRKKSDITIAAMEANIDLIQTMLELYEEAEDAAKSTVKKEQQEEFRRFAQSNLKSIKIKEPRKIELTSDQESLAKFAFLFSQWEYGYGQYKQGKKPYGQFFAGESGVVIRETEFLQQQYEELNPLFQKAMKIKGPGKKLERLVEKEYITEEQAKQTSSYLNLASKLSGMKKLMGRDALELSLKVAAQQTLKKEKDLTGEEVQIFVPEMSDEIAEVVSNYVNEESLMSRVSDLTTLLTEETAQKLLAANPNLIITDDISFEDYMNTMQQYIAGTDSIDAVVKGIEADTKKFSDPRQLKNHIQSMYGKEQPVAVEIPQPRVNEYKVAFRNRGYDFDLVEAIIVKGVKINKKIIGGRYIPSNLVVKNLRSFFKKNPGLRAELDKTLKWLDKEKVLLIHYGKGKSAKESTISLYPHPDEIEWAPLRNYVSETFAAYGIGAHENGEN